MRVVVSFFIFIFFFNKLYASNIKWNFEEVYQDGSIQSGTMLFKEGLMRYQYDKYELFTIIYNKNYFLIRNNDHKIVNKIKNDELIDKISKILESYPNIENTFEENDYFYLIEKSKKSDFIKRISIKSNKANLSIYFNDCSFEEIAIKYFQPYNFVEIN